MFTPMNIYPYPVELADPGHLLRPDVTLALDDPLVSRELL